VASAERPALSPLQNADRARAGSAPPPLADGKRVKEIAYLLHVGVKTVESDRQNIMDKLEIHRTSS